MQKMAAEIFSDMVMEEAIRDKTIQVEQKLKDEQTGQLHDVSDKSGLFHQHQEEEGDEDDFIDEEEEKMMRGIRERRLADMKNHY
jgi:hypothetical protein